MKLIKCILVIIMSMALQVVCAQTWEEWMEQKKTSLKYLTEQIMALKAYSGSLDKGYEILQKGLSTIGALKQDDYNLHAQRYDALSNTNPLLEYSAKVKGSQELLLKITSEFIIAEKFIFINKHLQSDEKKYLRQVLEHYVRSCHAIAHEIKMVTNHGTVQLTDGERMVRLDAAYRQTQTQLQFFEFFKKEVKLLALNRLGEMKDVRMGERLYGLE